MTEKRYFERKWEGEYYIFDSYTISEKDFDEKVEYEDYQAFADSMTGEEVTDRLNKYNKAYLDCHNDVLRLEKENEKLKNKLKFFNELNKPYGDIIKENEQLKQFQDRVFSWIDMHLQRLPTLIDKEFNSDNEFADPSLYSGALQILETMKKELKE